MFIISSGAEREQKHPESRNFDVSGEHYKNNEGPVRLSDINQIKRADLIRQYKDKGEEFINDKWDEFVRE